MIDKRDKHIFIYISSIVLYLIWRKNSADVNCIYDNILLIYIVIGLWHFIFNSRYYVLTRDKLRRYKGITRLYYKNYVKKGIVKKIYIRVSGTKEWYQLDHTLCYLTELDEASYNLFIYNNNTVDKLLTTMNYNYFDATISNQYTNYISDYEVTKILTLLTVSFCSMLYILYIISEILGI